MAVLILLVGAFAFAAASCGGDDEGGTTPAGTGGEETAGDNQVTALPSSSCEAVEYEGDGEPDVLIATDLPMQGSSRTQTVQMVEATRFVLEQRGWKAGGLDIAFQACDDSTAQAGKWDSGKCSQNAQAYASNADVVGVLGTFN
ncbi:MAG: hypothetical protein WD805_01050, partial [Gaiellaceae bacterium]